MRDVGESPTHAPATKIAPLEAPAHCNAGHPRSDATAGRCPPTGGTADKVRKILSKIAARKRNIFAKKRNLARKRNFF